MVELSARLPKFWRPEVSPEYLLFPFPLSWCVISVRRTLPPPPLLWSGPLRLFLPDPPPGRSWSSPLLRRARPSLPPFHDVAVEVTVIVPPEEPPRRSQSSPPVPRSLSSPLRDGRTAVAAVAAATSTTVADAATAVFPPEEPRDGRGCRRRRLHGGRVHRCRCHRHHQSGRRHFSRVVVRHKPPGSVRAR